MRFLADGPSIPDDLLLARDRGQVVFFCGAGVSRARAQLPDFFGLANKVVTELRLDQDSPAYRFIQKIKKIDQCIGIPGFISMDRVFGLLERDFDSRHIEAAVAAALKPPAGCDLTAHKILLDLATTPQGTVQLITTNFDRLFDECGRNLRVWQPPRLPDTLRPNEINGIVYLHGRSKSDYTGAENGGFVLSTSEFGRAYLSEGWATKFIREILAKYIVVFIGYTADDPPVQYLLEALHRTPENRKNAYAFQADYGNNTVEQWKYKGVEAISYSPNNEHAALWQSLEAWAERAKDHDAWYSKVINLSHKGPAALQPHERGQVAHIISTHKGAELFCNDVVPPPAEWLCVFDKHQRFANPQDLRLFDNENSYIDPFDLYGLDSDTPPIKSPLIIDDYVKRIPPSDAWDAFELNHLDRLQIHDCNLVKLHENNLATLQGNNVIQPPYLTPRIESLGRWLANVCHQSTAIWWAAHQRSLHKSIQTSISWELTQKNCRITPSIRKAWWLLFETWNYSENLTQNWDILQATIRLDGWNSAVVRQLGKILQPYLSVKPHSSSISKLLELETEQNNVYNFLKIDVEYPQKGKNITVTNKWCSAVVKVLRQNLELALALEYEISGYNCGCSYRLSNIPPIAQNSINDANDTYQHGLSAAIIQFTKLFLQLVNTDKLAAQHEFLSWPIDDDTIFSRLRICASKERCIVSDNDFGQFIESLSDIAFWDNNHKPDLLFVIAERWKKLSSTSRKLIEQRLLKGSTQWPQEEHATYESRPVSFILDRIQSLQESECKLSSATLKQAEKLRAAVPNWRKDYDANTAVLTKNHSGFAKTDTSYEVLMNTPLSQILLEIQKTKDPVDDFSATNNPYSSLAAQRPVRAFAVLTYAAKQNIFPEWAWQCFLSFQARQNDKIRMSRLIAERLVRYSNEQITTIHRPVINWLHNTCMNLNIMKLVDILRKLPNERHSDIKCVDWVDEALDSPVGQIAQTLLNDPRKNKLNKNQGLPLEWRTNAEALLSLPDDLRRHTLVILFKNLNYFFDVDPNWTEQHLLPALESNDTNDYEATWSGFLMGGEIPNGELYRRLKDNMLQFALRFCTSMHSSYSEFIAGIILAGWGNVDDATNARYISDDEMRNLLLKLDDEFRLQILDDAQRWIDVSDGNLHEHRQSQLCKLLEIWPRQRSARSSWISAKFCELVFSNGDQFPTLTELILPLLSKIEQNYLISPLLYLCEDNIIDRYPEQVLELFHAVLPDNTLAWPYRMGEILQRIGKTDKIPNNNEN